MDFTINSAYAEYLMETMKQQDDMERCITEALIISSGVDVNAKLSSLNEAAGAKLKEMWEKFTAFIKRITAKFMENITKLVENDKGYLEKYEKIIKGKPFKLNVSYKDYRLDRITSTQIPLFNYSSLQTKLESKSAFMHSIINDFGEKDNADDLTGWCKAYFCNGTEEENPVQNINMTDLYNFCHDYKSKTVPNIQKDQRNIEQSASNANTLIVNAIRAQENAQKQVASAAESQPAASPTPAAATSASTTQTSAKIESHNLFGSNNPYSSLLNKVLGEAKIEAAPDGGTSTAPNTPNGQKFSANAANTSGEGETKDTATATVAGAQGLTETKVSEIISTYSSVVQSIFSAKLTVVHSAYRDFMQVIRAHVKMYVGDENTPNQTAKAATNYGNQQQQAPQPAEQPKK